jgi:hypothetical protein
MAGDGVEQLDGVVVAGQLLLPLFFDKAEVDGFLVAQARQLVAHGIGAALVLGAQLGRDRGQRLGGRQVFVADHAGHFLDQIFFQIDVEAEGRRSHRNHAFRSHGGRQAQAVQGIQALLLRHGHADDLGRTRHAQLHGLEAGILGCWSSMAPTCVSGVPQISSTSAVMRSMCSVVSSGPRRARSGGRRRSRS